MYILNLKCLLEMQMLTEVISCMYDSLVWREDWAGDKIGDSLAYNMALKTHTHET